MVGPTRGGGGFTPSPDPEIRGKAPEAPFLKRESSSPEKITSSLRSSIENASGDWKKVIKDALAKYLTSINVEQFSKGQDPFPEVVKSFFELYSQETGLTKDEKKIMEEALDKATKSAEAYAKHDYNTSLNLLKEIQSLVNTL